MSEVGFSELYASCARLAAQKSTGEACLALMHSDMLESLWHMSTAASWLKLLLLENYITCVPVLSSLWGPDVPT